MVSGLYTLANFHRNGLGMLPGMIIPIYVRWKGCTKLFIKEIVQKSQKKLLFFSVYFREADEKKIKLNLLFLLKRVTEY